MASHLIKNVVVIGASGTIGAPIVSALLANKTFNVTIVSRKESIATFPYGVDVKKVDLSSQQDLVEAFKDQDAIICTLNDAAVSAQTGLIEAAVEAGVKRFIPSEWANIDLKASVPELEEGITRRLSIIELLDQKAKDAAVTGKVFHWTAVNCGVFFDWGLRAAFLDISLPPTKHAVLWDGGSNSFSATNLSTVGTAIVAILRNAEAQTRDRFVNIESFSTSQVFIVAALQEGFGEKWTVEMTTTNNQLDVAQKSIEENNFLGAYYRWIRAGLFSGQKGCRLDREKLDNDLLALPKENMQDVVDRILQEWK